MNESPSDKPVRELLEQIHTAVQTTDVPRGVVPPMLLDRCSFYVTVALIVTIAGLLLAMLWDLIAVDFGWKWIASMMVVYFAFQAVRFLNSNTAR